MQWLMYHLKVMMGQVMEWLCTTEIEEEEEGLNEEFSYNKDISQDSDQEEESAEGDQGDESAEGDQGEEKLQKVKTVTKK